MKSIKLSLVLLGLSVTGFFTTVAAQSKFEGKVVYGIQYEDVPQEMEGYESMLPQEMSIHIKGPKTRLEQSMGMGGQQVVITNTETKVSSLLLDLMGQKIHIKLSKEEVEENEKLKVKPEVKYVNEKKKIAGYKCKKAELTYETGETITVYYTEKIPSSAHNEYSYLKGYPLEYQSTQSGMMVTLSAKEVKETSIEDSSFEVPEGYDEMSMDEFQQMIGGMGN